MIEEAKGRAERFEAISHEAAVAPEASRYRLYMETIGNILDAPDKLVLDQKNGGPVSYLPLSELMSVQNRSSTTSTAAKPTQSGSDTAGGQQ